mmetsp:Transcript_15071/g.25608  ORF Transcript_15071/g.25608 Transcript_15071/m.25608 type:complete len:209 (+) Transcript_15071:347-973(+)
MLGRNSAALGFKPGRGASCPEESAELMLHGRVLGGGVGFKFATFGFPRPSIADSAAVASSSAVGARFRCVMLASRLMVLPRSPVMQLLMLMTLRELEPLRPLATSTGLDSLLLLLLVSKGLPAPVLPSLCFAPGDPFSSLAFTLAFGSFGPEFPSAPPVALAAAGGGTGGCGSGAGAAPAALSGAAPLPRELRSSLVPLPCRCWFSGS